ncbi:hypothetical protein SAMN06265222_106101 [Neorhodopirellula lusitana]|uniref:Uncharacterized protein n=1 Tax=Neorhodopirellula lusitana TaxID=445327 RepID=A0ABY1Q555_9BACT|nr:hypothetical protein SAMN06265222_106101 [Neorhodopirellula lusitana]
MQEQTHGTFKKSSRNPEAYKLSMLIIPNQCHAVLRDEKRAHHNRVNSHPLTSDSFS